MASGSPQTIPQKTHSFHKAKMHTTPPRPFHHTTHTSAHLISCVGGATTPPHNHTHFTPSLPFPWPYSPHNHTGVVHLRGQRSGGTGDTPTYQHVTCTGPTSEARAHNATPNRKEENLHQHTHTAHRPWDTPTSLIRP